MLNLPPKSKASRAFIGKLVRGSVEEGEILNVKIEEHTFSFKVIYCEVYKRKMVKKMVCTDDSHGISINIMNNEKAMFVDALRIMRKDGKSPRDLVLKKKCANEATP